MHPNNHVNLSQSTNDTNPTALNVALDDYCTRLIDKSIDKKPIRHGDFFDKHYFWKGL